MSSRKHLVLSRNADPKTLNTEQRRYIREDLGFVNKTSAEWTSENPVLGEGEQGYDKDRKTFKIGDGVTAWNDLSYIVNVASPTTSVIATTYTATVLDKTILANDDTAGALVTVTLPPAATAGDGFEVVIMKLGTTADIVIDGDGAETINGAATHTLIAQYESVKLITNGTTWFIIEA